MYYHWLLSDHFCNNFLSQSFRLDFIYIASLWLLNLNVKTIPILTALLSLSSVISATISIYFKIGLFQSVFSRGKFLAIACLRSIKDALDTQNFTYSPNATFSPAVIETKKGKIGKWERPSISHSVPLCIFHLMRKRIIC